MVCKIDNFGKGCEITLTSVFEFDKKTGSIIKYNDAAGNDVIIPDSIYGIPVVMIGDKAFENKGLINISLPNSLVEIGHDAFKGNRLVKILMPKSVAFVKSGAFANNNITCVEFIGFSEMYLDRFKPKSHLKSIGDGVFYNNNIEWLNLPYGSYTIGKDVFRKNDLTCVMVTSQIVYHNESFDSGVLVSETNI